MLDRTQRFLKEYTYWSVRLHGNQGYLGRCLLWSKEDSAVDVSDCSPEAWAEAQNIFRELTIISKKLFQPDRVNVAFLGNVVPKGTTPHLHGHFIPRYATPRVFSGVTFEDTLWGKNYQTDDDFLLSDEVTQTIVDAYRQALL